MPARVRRGRRIDVVAVIGQLDCDLIFLRLGERQSHRHWKWRRSPPRHTCSHFVAAIKYFVVVLRLLGNRKRAALSLIKFIFVVVVVIVLVTIVVLIVLRWRWR